MDEWLFLSLPFSLFNIQSRWLCSLLKSGALSKRVANRRFNDSNRCPSLVFVKRTSQWLKSQSSTVPICPLSLQMGSECCERLDFQTDILSSSWRKVNSISFSFLNAYLHVEFQFFSSSVLQFRVSFHLYIELLGALRRSTSVFEWLSICDCERERFHDVLFVLFVCRSKMACLSLFLRLKKKVPKVRWWKFCFRSSRDSSYLSSLLSFVFYLSVVNLSPCVSSCFFFANKYWNTEILESFRKLASLFISHSLDIEQKNLERCILTLLCFFVLSRLSRLFISLLPSVSLPSDQKVYPLFSPFVSLNFLPLLQLHQL